MRPVARAGGSRVSTVVPPFARALGRAAFWLDDRVCPSHLGRRQRRDCTGRPADLDPVDGGLVPRRDEDAGVVCREVASSPLELTPRNYAPATVRYDRRADRGTVRPAADELQPEPRTGGRLVQQDGRAAVQDADHDVGVAVVVEVAEGGAAGDVTAGEEWTGVRDLAENADRLLPPDPGGLRLGDVFPELVQVVVDVPVDDQ